MGDGYRSEYVGFKVNEATRDYTLSRNHAKLEGRDFIVATSNKAFIARRVRYQDAPDICVVKLRRALAGAAEMAAARMTVTDAELDEYREAHAPLPSKPRPKYLVIAKTSWPCEGENRRRRGTACVSANATAVFYPGSFLACSSVWPEGSDGTGSGARSVGCGNGEGL